MEQNIFTSQMPFLTPNQYGMCTMMTAVVNLLCYFKMCVANYAYHVFAE